MKVLFDQQIFFRQKYGGISRYYARVADELKSLGHQPKIFGGVNINHYLQEVQPGIVIGKSLDKYPSKSVGVFNRLNGKVGGLVESLYKPEIIHETYFSAKPTFKSKAPVVVGVYDMIQELFPQLFPKEHLTTDAKRKALKRADHIISISQHTKEDCCELFQIPEEKVSVVHLAADIPYSDFSSIHFENERPYFLYVGDRAGYKNFIPFIKAFSRVGDLVKEVDIIAFGGRDFNKEELELFRQSGLKEGQVQYLSGDDRLLGKLYSKAIALVYPSLYEGFGIPPLEAMSYQCPVLASNKSCIPEVVREGGYLFDPENLDEMREALERVWKDDSFKKDLISKGTDRLSNFSWKKTALEHTKVYQSLI